MTAYEDLPGWELVSAGLADLNAGRQTVPAMLVASAIDPTAVRRSLKAAAD